MAAGGQTLNDRILAARHSLAGQGLAKAVCKATTEELIGPKRKHLEYLLRCTDEPNVSIPTLANLLVERTQSQNWIVVFKSLVTIHHLMCYGNERFTQYLASSNTNFQLSNFLDKGGIQDKIQTSLAQAVMIDPYAKAMMKSNSDRLRALGGNVRGYDMSPFVRRYSKYLREKAVAYRSVAFDFCKVKRGKDGGTLRSMSAEKLLKTLPVLHEQLDALLEFEATAQDLNNGVINSAFVLLFKDLIRLFACYNDGIINLLEKYFEMNKKNARDALDIYKKFLIRMDRVADFLKVAENIGMDRSDIPDLAKAPSSLLEALEAHLASLEGRKPGSIATTPTGGAGRVNVAAAVNILSSTSSAFGNTSQIDEKLQKQLLAEEEAAMAKYRGQGKGTNPFAAAESAATAAPGASTEAPNILDLFGMSDSGGAAKVEAGGVAAPAQGSNKASDDLLQLSGNPFTAVLNAAGNSAQQQQYNSSFATGFPQSNANGPSFFAPAPHQQMAVMSPSFGSDNSFNNVFGASASNSYATNGNSTAGADFFGDILQPQGSGTNGHNGSNGNSAAKLVDGNLDSSIANLTSNLNLGANQKKPIKSFDKPKGPPMATSAAMSKTRPF